MKIQKLRQLHDSYGKHTPGAQILRWPHMEWEFTRCATCGRPLMLYRTSSRQAGPECNKWLPMTKLDCNQAAAVYSWWQVTFRDWGKDAI